MLTKEMLRARAKKPAEEALRLHPLYKGKVHADATRTMREAREATQLLMRENYIRDSRG